MAQKEQSVGSEKTDLSIRAIITAHKIRWTVKNISKVPIGEMVISRVFYLTPEFTACVSLRKLKDTLQVCICNKSDTEIKIKRIIELSDYYNMKLHVTRDAKIFSLEKDMKKDVTGDITNRSAHDNLPKDMLIIDLCVCMVETAGTEIRNPFEYDEGSIRKLRGDFKTMLENPVNSDVCLQVGNERIPAHWSILCSRSPHFKRMFDSQMQERVLNSITITDISVSTLKNLIKFLYTAYFFEDNNGDNIKELFDLYYAADKYELVDLRTLCSRRIMLIATASNMGQILQLAQRHNDKDLNAQVMSFIQLNPEAVFKSNGWKKFEASEPLIADIFHFCFKKK